MIGPSIEMTADVLHIRSAPVKGSPAERMEARLEAGLSTVAVCGDVYHGLARLVRRRGEWSPVVFVCVDDISPAEMEFFRITARSLPATDVYVYGAERSSKRVAGAIERGATGEVTDDLLNKLSLVADPIPASASNTDDTIVSVSEIFPGSSKTRRSIENAAPPLTADTGRDSQPAVPGREASRETESGTAPAPVVGAASGSPSDTVEGSAGSSGIDRGGMAPAATQTEWGEGETPELLTDRATGVIPCGPISETSETVASGDPVDTISTHVESPTPIVDDNPDDDMDDDTDDDVDSSGVTGRVPWLRYDNVPVRKAPSRKRPEDEPRHNTGAPTPPSLREPLLSEEELRALIGDDVAAIGPDDDDDEPVQGGSNSEEDSR